MIDLARLLDVPAERATTLASIAERLLAARTVALTTHVNADGDGAGSQAALAAWLEARGVRVSIVNPTPFPDQFRFLLHRADLVADLGAGGEQALDGADLVAVLDTSEANRVRPLDARLDAARTVVIDHHPPGPSVVGSLALQDATAAATGELMYDLFSLDGGAWPAESARGLYLALVSDTGGFRHSNTTPRVHAIAAAMLARGVDAEAVQRRLFGSLPLRRLHLLREALHTLETRDGVSWMVVTDEVARRLQITPDDLEGLVEHARSVEGTEVAALFRELPDGATKVSLRSNGAVDVNAVARRFGGGGHVKASGAAVAAAPGVAVEQVLGALADSLGRGA